ncbi:hypothetical protein DLAC_09441 [Tieghemostelium lacteum]|uniref:Uncharacterized protein n=1 Tax=Tieghemostelium lacteum TaxID=361077 RepID=A0A151ZA18_TIELA|nr:hypothetical protein DLAC_09441 [Tieghemostelium lacteum]|eukprot:KYQ90800.1 hypothetical protein DLAC_09441 [Tieghemostelium lacteum]
MLNFYYGLIERPGEKLELLQTPFQNIEPMWQSITVKANEEDDDTCHKKIALPLNLNSQIQINFNINAIKKFFLIWMVLKKYLLC